MQGSRGKVKSHSVLLRVLAGERCLCLWNWCFIHHYAPYKKVNTLNFRHRRNTKNVLQKWCLNSVQNVRWKKLSLLTVGGQIVSQEQWYPKHFVTGAHMIVYCSLICLSCGFFLCFKSSWNEICLKTCVKHHIR